MKRFSYLLSVALPVLALAACNQADPEGDGESGAASGDSGTEPSMIEGDYFPLAEGATWTYQHINPDGVTWDEIVNMRQVTYNGATAFEAEDNEDSNGENTIATFVEQDGKVMRVHKEVMLGGGVIATVDYDPGFLRFDHTWLSGDRAMWDYNRTEYDADGNLSSDNTRNLIFAVESLSTSVTVPAGTFDCVQFVRTRVDNGDSKRFWFAEGVGKIRHESLNTGSVEELTEYQIP